MTEAPDTSAAQGELAEIRGLMQDQHGPYWRGPDSAALQDRYRSLLEGGTTAPSNVVERVRGGPPAVARPGAPITAETFEAEAKAIQSKMKEDNAGYWRDEATQQRYRELAEASELGYAARPIAEVRAATGLASDGQARAAQDAVVNVLRDLPDVDARQSLVEGFDEAMPPAARGAVYAELARRDVTAPAASAADVERFATTPEGRDLARQWGDRAPVRLGILRARLGRIMAAVPGVDREQVVHFIDSMSPAEFQAVANALTGGR